MNLNNNPTKEQFAALIGAADDEDGHHILWVDLSGEVRVTPLPDDISPVHWETRFPTTRLRFETFCVGNGYVGPEAAEDDTHINMFFSWLQRAWANRGSSDKAEFVDR